MQKGTVGLGSTVCLAGDAGAENRMLGIKTDTQQPSTPDGQSDGTHHQEMNRTYTLRRAPTIGLDELAAVAEFSYKQPHGRPRRRICHSC